MNPRVYQSRPIRTPVPDATPRATPDAAADRRWPGMGYVGSVLLVGAGLAAQAGVMRALGSHVSFQFVLLPIAASAWLFGLRATLLAIVAGSLGQLWFFVEPRDSLWITSPGEAVQFALFLVISLVIAIQYERLKRARAARASSARELIDSDRARLASERRLDAGLDAMPDPILMLRPARDPRSRRVADFVVEYANEAATRALAAADTADATAAPGGIVGRRLSAFAPHHGTLGLIEDYASVVETGASLDRAVVVPVAPAGAGGAAGTGADDGEGRIVEVRADRLGDGLIVQWRDVTDQRRAEQQARLGEQRYRSLVETSGAIVWGTSADGAVVAPQPAWAAFTGQRFDATRGDGWLAAVHPDEREAVRAAWADAVTHGRPYEVERRLRRADGEYRDMLVRGVPVVGADGGIREWVGVDTDVTDRRRAEQIVAGSERQLRRVLNGLYAFVGVLLPDGTLVGANEAPLRDAGLTAGDVIGRKLWDCYWFDYADEMRSLLRRWAGRSAAGEVVRGDVACRMAGGRMITVDFMIAPLRDEEGQVTHLIASSVDVSARVRAQTELADRERRFRRLYESNLAGIVFYLPDGTLSDPNEAFLEMLGYHPAPSDGDGPTGEVPVDRVPDGPRNWRDLIPPEWAEADRLEQSTLESSGRCGPYEMEMTRADGTRVPVLVTAADLEPGVGSIGVASVVDLTHAKRVEEALRRTEAELRMANESLEHRIQERTLELQHRSDQLRALALDITETESRERKRLAQLLHDHFQQLVSAAKLKVGMVRRKLTDPGLIETVTQVESLLEETINASRSLATELSPPVLHDAGLGPALEWLGRRMEKDHNLPVRVRFDPGSEPDNEQVRTIVFECARELLFNITKHAGPTTAELDVAMAAEGLLQVTVVDHGRGFDAHSLEMQAKPDGSFGLFSIKERLGLLGGLVKLRSHVGQGTTVTMTVPVSVRHSMENAPLGSLVDLPTVAADAGVPSVRVVVADDHRLFREGLISLITQESFVEIVGQANDGEEAVALALALRPDILIVDVTMPKLNGVQVTSRLRRELPEVKVIGLSMHERDDMAQAMREAGAVAYCTKGGPTEVLLNVLRSVASAAR